MAYWLLKTEPEEFSWDDQVKRGAKGEAWTGVRNFSFGIELGRGRKPEDIHGGLAEGVFTAPVLLAMARERAVDMPIATAVAALLDGTLTVDAAIESLLTRPLKAEG